MIYSTQKGQFTLINDPLLERLRSISEARIGPNAEARAYITEIRHHKMVAEAREKSKKKNDLRNS